MNIDEYKTIYYRGPLRSCNYKCVYCPFSKRSVTARELQRDKESLHKLTHFLRKGKTGVTLFIVPYGEALIHDYYLEAIAELSGWENVERVCVQTNNSFSLPKLLDFLGQNNGRAEKLKLWCSYHPGQVTFEKFLSKCLALRSVGIEFSVGAVANRTETEALTKMRQQLPSDIYMWLNKMDGSKMEYTSDERDKFLSIDPFFELQLMKIKSNMEKCIGGRESVFIDGDGNMFPCNMNRYSIGNIYESRSRPVKCICADCACFLAYSNRRDLPLLELFGRGLPLRILPKSIKGAYFFDIDGTILDRRGQLSPEKIEEIKNLSVENYIFLNTALPAKRACEKCKKILKYITGGVFGNGSDIQIFKYGYRRITPMDSSILEMLDKNGSDYFLTYENGTLLKLLLKHRSMLPEPEEPLQFKRQYNISQDGSQTIITGANASKLNGALFLCGLFGVSPNMTVAVGNSENDRQIISYFAKCKSYSHHK